MRFCCILDLNKHSERKSLVLDKNKSYQEQKTNKLGLSCAKLRLASPLSLLLLLKKGPIKFGQNWVSHSLDIPGMDKRRQDKCFMDKCHPDRCHMLKMVPRPCF